LEEIIPRMGLLKRPVAADVVAAVVVVSILVNNGRLGNNNDESFENFECISLGSFTSLLSEILLFISLEKTLDLGMNSLTANKLGKP
jgi:hypothetical protein